MIIKIFKVSTKEMYIFSNKIELFNFIKTKVEMPIFYNKTIPQLIECLPAEEYCRIK